MENRKQSILRAVVKEFTTSAVPVGSQALQSRYFVNLSSATIRSGLRAMSMPIATATARLLTPCVTRPHGVGARR